MIKTVVGLLTAVLVVTTAHSAVAFQQFHDPWVEMYVDKDDPAEENQAFVQSVTKGKDRCLVCHQGPKRKYHNPYGLHFLGLLGKEDRKNEKKIIAVIKQIGALSVNPQDDPQDPHTVTYDQLIAQKKLPGGEWKVLQMKPEERAQLEGKPLDAFDGHHSDDEAAAEEAAAEEAAAEETDDAEEDDN